MTDNYPRSIRAWQQRVDAWCKVTFIHTSAGIVRHMIREVVELGHAVGLSRADILHEVNLSLARMDHKPIPDVCEETSDILILSLGLAGHHPFDLEAGVEAKHARNLVRKWGKPDQSGVTEHIEG